MPNQINKIKIDEYSLNLEKFDISDTVGLLITKLNRNFDEIQSYGGGPEGKDGRPGPIGCSGPPGPPGPVSGGADDWEAKLSTTLCDSLDAEYTDIRDRLDYNNLLYNKWAHKTFLHRNLLIETQYENQLKPNYSFS